VSERGTEDEKAHEDANGDEDVGQRGEASGCAAAGDGAVVEVAVAAAVAAAVVVTLSEGKAWVRMCLGGTTLGSRRMWRRVKNYANWG